MTEPTAAESGQVELNAGLGAEAALQRLGDECWDLRCCSGSIADTGDHNVWWEVWEHRMRLTNGACIGYGRDPLSAITDATLPAGDPRRSDYVPPELDRLVADNANSSADPAA